MIVYWLGIFVKWFINIRRLFDNAKDIFVKEQYWYYLIHGY